MRWTRLRKFLAKKISDERDHLLTFSYEVLHTSGFYDDERDQNRTMSNMESSTIVYVDERLPHMHNWPIWVQSKKDPNKIVGIEQAFDVVLTFHDGFQVRVIGTIDGLVIQAATGLNHIDENKTSVRLDRAWREAFELSHQITNYCATSSIVYGFPVMHSRVTGVKIKPSGGGDDCIVLEPAMRTPAMVGHWATWVHEQARKYELFENDYEHAQRYTHSCNRYFRPCSLIPFCGDTPEGREKQWEQMIPSDMTPSEKRIAKVKDV